MIKLDELPETAHGGVDDAPVDPSADAPASADRISRRAWITTAILTVLTVALVVLGIAFWVQYQDNVQRDADRQAALDRARHVAVTLTTVTPDTVEHQVNTLLANATGEFRMQFDAASPMFGKVVSDGKVVSKGTVAQAGVVSLSADEATVLVALNSTVRNAQSKADEPRDYRLQVELEKEGDQWLVSNMHFVP